jgi:ABC-type antimicrobial peptide transport system permease subunit
LLAETALLVLGGVVVGLGLGFAGSRVLSSLLHGISARDPLVFALSPLVLLLAALLASWVPLHRAIRIDPAQALRYE